MDTSSDTFLQYKGFVETPSIFKESSSLIQIKAFHLENEIHSTPTEINNNLMLGKRAEQFFKHQINFSNRYTIELENIQIQKDKRTIGELDFLLRENKTLELTHVEIAYKFYLFDESQSGNEIDKWIGPNRNDNFHKKLNKLANQQFPLLFLPETKNQLQLKEKFIQQKLLFKAQLFIPYGKTNLSFEKINLKAIKGTYLNIDTFVSLDWTNSYFHVPKKQNWLISPELNTQWASYESSIEEIKNSISNQKSPLIWIKHTEDSTESMFITWW
ncbi:DUF1853 family protein [Flavicella marina]|uniref:DUF1853 family protein n=1 Tax=Flavicella marina TaxID=1475951 RepID=UPI00186B3366|nr:DUF1853 family protein [Flavicella marina]